ncbi:HtaA domain-containing protein [Natronosporangium hydrolyticum]|uniref:HtaA domain-containing protein n=1 Tax=Natronosporangium hydrolyticum TaxID=2811111 RepID=A0A895YJI6_9ACTN|nr:HtaA domain-containing protein [Natronosporangium hydrolyticum]QSB14280.1 HtaA domain-containing protein [Natronosporangium hydrolyticum]
MTTGSARPRRAGLARAARWVAAVAVGLVAAATGGVGVAAAAESDIADGHLDWGFKQSFRQYVSNGNGNPPIAASDGAAVNSDGTFRFPVTGGTYDDSSGATTVHHGGTIVFSYPAHFFEITIANPTVVISGGNGVLLADVELVTSGGGFEPVDEVQAEIAELATAGSSPIVDGGVVRWEALAATMTANGAEAFAGFYGAGEALDPVSFAFSTDGSVPTDPETATVTVTPASGLDPAGATIQVSGSGFDPTSPGINLAFGPATGDWWSDSSQYLSAKWVHPGGNPGGNQDRLNSDGTFSTTLEVAGEYTDGGGNQVDCVSQQCYVVTMRAHGQPDRSQDTRTPIEFAGGPPGTGGSDEQQITVDVLGGPLTLSVAGDSVQLSDAAIGGTATGELNQAEVEDLRGTNAGWSLVGQVGEFTGDAGTFPGNQLGWAPQADVVSGPGLVAPGSPVGSGLGDARTLCSAGAGASAGTFECGAELNLGIPGSAAPGRYTATLTLTLA